VAQLADNAEDGTPPPTPVGLSWTGTEFVISPAASSPRIAALNDRPDIALSIDGYDVRPRPCPVRTPAGERRDRRRAGAAYLAAARGSMHADTVAELKNCLELYE